MFNQVMCGFGAGYTKEDLPAGLVHTTTTTTILKIHHRYDSRSTAAHCARAYIQTAHEH